ncbi:MAG: hypothetical protein ACE15C_08330 [Phycisphaerae bacterium]
MATAETLQSQGLITFRLAEYVRCTNPLDRDFSGRRSSCSGQVVIDPNKDEDADDYECPKCGRTICPNRHGKRRHRVLWTYLQRPGALAWLATRLREVSDNVKALGDDTFHVGGFGDLGVIVHAADADGDPDVKFNRRGFAANTPVLYVTLNSCVPEGRLVKDAWLCRVGLADLLSGTADLRDQLARCPAAGSPKTLAAVDVPVYAKGHVLIQPEEEPHKDRLFVVELDGKVVRVNDEIVVNPQAGPRLALFRILWSQFLQDLAAGKAPEDFAALNMKKLLKAMAEAGHRYDDETLLRKVINNLQNDIATAVKRKIGAPIDAQDVVQTCRTASQSDTSGGYRINPFCVAVRPIQARQRPDLSQES